MKTAPVILSIFALATLFIASVLTMPTGAGAIAPCPTSLATLPASPTLTPSASPSLPATIARATATTIPRQASTTPTRPLPTNITPQTTPPTELAPIFTDATNIARDMTLTPGFNASTAIIQTANAFNTLQPSPTEDRLPTTATPMGGWYRVDAVAGMNLRAEPGTGQRTVGFLRYGDEVWVGEHRRVGDFVWGAVNGGWVAMVYDPDPNRIGEEVIYLRAIQR